MKNICSSTLACICFCIVFRFIPYRSPYRKSPEKTLSVKPLSVSDSTAPYTGVRRSPDRLPTVGELTDDDDNTLTHAAARLPSKVCRCNSSLTVYM